MLTMSDINDLIESTKDSNSDITPSHINVKVEPGEANVDADIVINVDTEEAKRVKLELDNLNGYLNDYYLVSDRLDLVSHYIESTELYGMNKPLAEIVTYHIPDLEIPRMESLTEQSIIDGIETKLALESMVSYIKKGYKVILELLNKIFEAISSLRTRVGSIFRDAEEMVSVAKNKLSKVTLDPIAFKTSNVNCIPFDNWAYASSKTQAVAALRTAMILAQHTADATDSKWTDRAASAAMSPIAIMAASKGSSDPNAAREYINRWVGDKLGPNVMQFYGITVPKEGPIEIDSEKSFKKLSREKGSLHTLNWSPAKVTSSANVARSAAEFGRTLPKLYEDTLRVVKKNIAAIEYSMNERYSPTAVKGLRRDRFHHKVYLISLELVNKLTWHIAKMSTMVAKEWVHVANQSISKARIK